MRAATKKKGNSQKRKGNAGEREIAKALNTRFAGYLSARPDLGQFSRSVGSGNRWSQAHLGNQSKQVYSGDLTCPEGFKFVIEVKLGYDPIDLWSVLAGESKPLEDFLGQAVDGAEATGRSPVLAWRKNRKAWLIYHRGSGAASYRGWSISTLDNWLDQPDSEFWT